MAEPAPTLAQVAIGDEVVVTGFAGELENAQRLREMGVLVGTGIKVIRFAPFGDPIEIEVRGYKLSLRKHEAESIEVKSTEP